MITVHVKHYLTPEGIQFAEAQWFPKVKKLMSQQPGYIDFYCCENIDNSLHLIVQFENQETLDQWVAHPEHDSFVNMLDEYRNRDYWEAALTEEPLDSKNKLTWINVPWQQSE